MSLGLNLSRGSNSLYSAFENFTIAEYQDQSLSIFFVKVNLILRFYPGECLKIQTIREALRTIQTANQESGNLKFLARHLMRELSLVGNQLGYPILEKLENNISSGHIVNIQIKRSVLIGFLQCLVYFNFSLNSYSA